MNQEAASLISLLQLERHPEGGWFREIYRSEGIIPTPGLPPAIRSPRNYSTSIYFLLQGLEVSALHRIMSDEIWHYYEGDSAVEIVMLGNSGEKIIRLGRNIARGEFFQYVVPARTWFGAYLNVSEGHALCGCTVSPGFDFQDFEIGNRTQLLHEYPGSEKLIRKLTID